MPWPLHQVAKCCTYYVCPSDNTSPIAEEHSTHCYSLLLGSRFLHCSRNFLSRSSIYCLWCGDQRVDGASSGGVCPIKEVRTFSVIWLPTPPLLEGGGILFLIATLLRKRVLKQHLFPFIVSINYKLLHVYCACIILHLLTCLQLHIQFRYWRIGDLLLYLLIKFNVSVMTLSSTWISLEELMS